MGGGGVAMSFKQLYSDGVAARCGGKTMLENPFYRPENLPVETASAYRAWQIKAEAWEQGWRAQDVLAAPKSAASIAQSNCCA
jgi:hypothetical protein